MGRTTSRRQPGYRFHPTDEELVVFYLRRKVRMKRFYPQEIAEVNIYKFAPWELPEKSISRSGDLKWYFFCPVEKKYANGAKMNRTAEYGYWKSTGKCKTVYHNGVLVGSRKTLIFHNTSEEQRVRTDWVMHEYSLKDVQNTYVLCKIFQKGGRGPRNGAQYGAPFKEEDWSDWSDVEVADSAAATGTTSLTGAISESCLSETVPSSYCEGVLDVPHNNIPSEFCQVSGDIRPAMLAHSEGENSMLAYHPAEGNTMISCRDEKNKNLSQDKIDADPFFDDLINIINWDDNAAPSVDGCCNLYDGQEACFHQEDGFSMNDLSPPLDS